LPELGHHSRLTSNTAELLGPEGTVGKHHKNSLHGQDMQLFSPGNADVGVFVTAIGRLLDIPR
jgi:hypothetical protein